MADHPPVYSDHDRHQVLMNLAVRVVKQVTDNPHPDDHQDTHSEPLFPGHMVASGK